jgi:hypothetical protein
MTKWLAALFITAISCVSSVSAQDVSLFVAGTSVRLGMPKSALIGKFQKPFDLKQIIGKTDEFIIREQDASGVYNIVGMLWFKEDRLTRASKTWLNEDGNLKSSELMDVLYSVLTQMEQRRETSPTIALNTTKEPGDKTQWVNLHYRLRTIVIVATDSVRFGKTIEVSEEIGSIR